MGYGLEQLLQEWEKDSIIDSLEPGKEQIRIPNLHGKYLRILSECKLLAKKFDQEYKNEIKIKWNYYNGNYNTDKEILAKLQLPPFKFILKANIDVYLESDPDLSQIKAKKDYYDVLISACEMILNELKNRVWELRSYIEWERFVRGG